MRRKKTVVRVCVYVRGGGRREGEGEGKARREEERRKSPGGGAGGLISPFRSSNTILPS